MPQRIRLLEFARGLRKLEGMFDEKQAKPDEEVFSRAEKQAISIMNWPKVLTKGNEGIRAFHRY